MISGIHLEIINYFKIVIVEKLITINKINLHQQSSSDMSRSAYNSYSNLLSDGKGLDSYFTFSLLKSNEE